MPEAESENQYGWVRNLTTTLLKQTPPWGQSEKESENEIFS